MIRLCLNRTHFQHDSMGGRLFDPQSGRGWDSIEPAAGYLPLGEYRVGRYHTEAYPNAFAVSAPSLGVYVRETDAPVGLNGSARIRQVIQPASFASELRGGIAIGKDRVRGPGGIWEMRRSRDAMNELRNLLGMAVDVTLSITSGSLP